MTLLFNTAATTVVYLKPILLALISRVGLGLHWIQSCDLWKIWSRS